MAAAVAGSTTAGVDGSLSASAAASVPADIGSPAASAAVVASSALSSNNNTGTNTDEEEQLCLHGISEEAYHNVEYRNAMKEWEELGINTGAVGVGDRVYNNDEYRRLDEAWEEKFSRVVIDEEFATFVFAYCVDSYLLRHNHQL